MFIKGYKVYGRDGHRQRVSFGESVEYKFPREYGIFGNCIINLLCADKTGSYDYVVLFIMAQTEKDCDSEFDGQLSDGIFENARYGKIEIIFRNEFHAN